jgi:hypothetical protein
LEHTFYPKSVSKKTGGAAERRSTMAASKGGLECIYSV